ncbi:MAG: HAD-IIA family hydrolase [Candidatus Altiarchaeales archaeon]|nr:HAD-IIA family hydrolase [Candidatus Altiarchaeales archaeon]
MNKGRSTIKEAGGFLFDMDGVIWRGDSLFPGAEKVVQKIRGEGKKILFVTNNASKTRKHFQRKLGSMGITVSEGELINSAYAASHYIAREQGPSKIHVLGSEGLGKELLNLGHTLVERGADFVVTGHTTECCWIDLRNALWNIHYDGAKFIACNADRTADHGEGLIPAAGAFMKALEYSSNTKPTVVGKPSKPVYDLALEILGLSKQECVMVGDNLETDVKGAVDNQIFSVLVETGVHDKADFDRFGVKPDLVLDSVADLEEYI